MLTTPRSAGVSLPSRTSLPASRATLTVLWRPIHTRGKFRHSLHFLYLCHHSSGGSLLPSNATSWPSRWRAVARSVCSSQTTNPQVSRKRVEGDMVWRHARTARDSRQSSVARSVPGLVVVAFRVNYHYHIIRSFDTADSWKDSNETEAILMKNCVCGIFSVLITVRTRSWTRP